MKKIAYCVGVMFITLGSYAQADSLDDLGEIKIVDESAKSKLFQREKIVGCTDFVKKKEMSCAKEPKDAILSKLPTSKQLEETDLKDDRSRAEMKAQLSSILAELNKLKKEQQASLITIKRLKSVINTLSKEKPNTTTEKMMMVKEIKEIKPKKKKSYTETLIRKKIKEISRTDTEVIVEVQSNESLSTYAQAYYNDNSQYYKIYKANKNKIPKSMVIIIGDHLRIPLN